MRAWLAVASVLMAPRLLAQEIRMPLDGSVTDWPGGAAFVPGGVALLWNGEGPTICPKPNGYRRDMALDGTFMSGDVPLIPLCANGYEPRVAVNPWGVIAVVEPTQEPPFPLYVRLFDASWNPVGPEFLVNSQPAYDATADITALPNGDFIVVWGSRDFPQLHDVVARIVKPDGTMPGPEVMVPETSGDSEFLPAVVTLPPGDVLAAWVEGATASMTVRTRVFDGSLNALTAETTINTSWTSTPVGMDAAALPSGAIVVWGRNDLSQPIDIIGRIVDLSGSPVGPELLINTNTADDQREPACGADAQGNVVVSWTSVYQDGSFLGVYAQRLLPTGVKLGGEFLVNGTTYGYQSWPGLGVRATGDFVIGWASDHEPPSMGYRGAYMRRYFFPVSLALAPGRGPANPASVQVLRPDGRAGAPLFSAYATTGQGANIGAGDVDGGIAEVLTGPGPSPAFGPHVRGFSPDGTPLGKVSFYAYGTLRYGARAAGGSIDGDAYAEILTAPGEGAVFGPHVRAFDYDGAALSSISKVSFYAYATLKWGGRVATGDIDGEPIREILTAPGPGIVFGPHIRGFNYDGSVLTSMGKVTFMAFSGPQYGATVGASDVESDGEGGYGDGYQEIVAGIGPDPSFAGPVRLFDYDGATVLQKYEVNPYSTRYGASVAGGDIDAGDVEEVVIAPGPDPAARGDVIVWEWDPLTGINPDGARLQKLGSDVFSWPGSAAYGANVAVGTFE